ncbi:MAG: XRE family transcriptional regulator [Thermodesulfobacteriota bacterium]
MQKTFRKMNERSRCATAAMTNLGDKIRKERLKRQLTLEQFSQKTGLSKSFLSQVERGLAEPSITSLKKVSKQLGFSVVNLFLDDSSPDPSWNYSNSVQRPNNKEPPYVNSVEVVRADKRKRLALPGSSVVYDLLTPDMKRQLEVMYMRVTPGESSGAEPMLDPPGEKMGIVLKGSIEVSVGDEVFQLGEGDSIYYPTDRPHSWRALEGDSVEVIWIMTPPSF